MKIIAFTNQKGGVGKTTSTLNVGTGLAKLGKRVLLIDLDPQAHLTASMVDSTTLEATVYEFLKGDASLVDAVISTLGVDLLPASLRLSGAEIEFSGEPGREFILKEALGDLSAYYDYVLIDCNPSLGLLTLNALTTAHEVYIPMQAEYLALLGMDPTYPYTMQ